MANRNNKISSKIGHILLKCSGKMSIPAEIRYKVIDRLDGNSPSFMVLYHGIIGTLKNKKNEEFL